ncbi:MAG: bifunctional phosphoribosyl-AMP cyclohydrolase/phosphoribosyl-ATP diphosphatase HisIE [Marinisporobacter sp.]|jgi:phosphoribosyl-ATP pyrophosphohydrolase/phosphoribosyl-AMP cyclohydrolase|nr:bifunctional phosphoribosyl-AMP cyclohydrolase/phosphoribosyl-ATP diphosphatase HisIE [Marinisporobacter sp.]
MENNLKFDEKGLIPAIIQDINTKKVLMMAYMNEESLEKTLETKKTWFYSRSRQKLWNKGETSGNYQIVKRISYDCDGDTLLVEVIPLGNACHTGAESCFFNKIFEENEEDEKEKIIQKLYTLIKERKTNPKEGSYTNYLFEKGIDKILKKVGEEASEVIIGAKNDERDEIIYEVADLIYHLLVLLVEKEITLEDIKKELYDRYNK